MAKKGKKKEVLQVDTWYGRYVHITSILMTLDVISSDELEHTLDVAIDKDLSFEDVE
jgi:hypothetical protein